MTARDRDRDAEGAEWAVRRREGLNRAEKAEFHHWLGENPANARAFEESDQVWDELAALDLAAIDARVEGRARRPTRRRAAFAAAAALAVGVVGTGWALYAPGGRAYATERGEVRTVRLADGSSVTLGARSKILVDYEAGERRVTLRAGEAVFDVVRDPARPFLVRAADTRVTVLGTRFVVKSAPDRVRVEVIRGEVRVAKAESPLIAPFIRNAAVGERVVRGQRLESPRGADLARTAKVDPAEAAAWTHGRLVYEDASLAEVVDDLGRYGSARVSLANDDLGALRVTAALSRDQAAQFLDTLPATLPVRLERQADGGIVIAPAA